MTRRIHSFVWSGIVSAICLLVAIVTTINTKNPIKTCKIYNLPEVLELLEKANDKLARWNELQPLLYVFV